MFSYTRCNLECPDYDLKNGNNVSSLGKCIPGIDMRITVATSKGNTKLALPNEPGNLEVRGDLVFDRYYRNSKATTEAFTSDGWFRTGDQAIVDSEGNLSLLGRAKDVFNLNGAKFASATIQRAVEQAVGTQVIRVISFPSRGAHTEQITVAYIPQQRHIRAEDFIKIDEMIVQACVLCTGHRPVVFSMAEKPSSLLPTTTLGKISRAKMSSLFEEGLFSQDVDLHLETVRRFRAQQQRMNNSANEAEALLIEDFTQTLRIAADTIGLDTPLFELGCTSMNFIQLKRRIDTRLGTAVPIATLMKNPTVRSMAIALHSNSIRSSGSSGPAAEVDYDPVLTLRPGGSKTPLWLVHPGGGEVLVFVGLAQHLNDDRPIYALRARGFEPEEEPFASIAEAVEIYVEAIRKRQPQGPYALAGYSYGGMLAFEIAKKLNSDDEGTSVRFLGCIDRPPRVIMLMNWNWSLLNLAQFLDVATEECVDSLEKTEFLSMSREEALQQLLKVADGSQMEELGRSEPDLVRWADIAFSLQVSSWKVF